MSNRTRPKHPCRRGKSPESIRFRKLMKMDEPEWLFEDTGINPKKIDFPALMAISRCVGRARIDGVVRILISPIERYDDHGDFDAAVCRAGLTAYVRPAMPSDWRGGIASDFLGELVLVIQARRGVRFRYPMTLTSAF
jgi:hypothetical protein